MEAEYDAIAEEYDATRDAATQAEIGALRRALEGCKTVLDVGVGSGRFAKPLSDLGFEVAGIDVSQRMLLKARQKEMERLLSRTLIICRSPTNLSTRLSSFTSSTWS